MAPYLMMQDKSKVDSATQHSAQNQGAWERSTLFLSLLLEQLQPFAYGKVMICKSLQVKKESFHSAEENRFAV